MQQLTSSGSINPTESLKTAKKALLRLAAVQRGLPERTLGAGAAQGRGAAGQGAGQGEQGAHQAGAPEVRRAEPLPGRPLSAAAQLAGCCCRLAAQHIHAC